MELFNVEHIIPKSFGSFRDAPTLSDRHEYRVCRECNTRLGRSLDIGLARNSWEGALRLFRGLKPPSAAEKLAYDRINITLPPDHPLAPVVLGFFEDAKRGRVVASPRPQLRISIENGPLTCVLEKDIAERLPPMLAKGRVTRVEIFCWAGDPGAQDRVANAAAKAGLDPQKWNEYPAEVAPNVDDQQVDLTFTIDALVARAIAKLAYEYFVWVGQEKAAGCFREDRFEPIRKFIVDGEPRDWRHMVRPTNRPILADESETLRRTQGHLVAITWDRSGIIVQVALFNDIVYHVRLAKPAGVIWPGVEGGHHFDLSSGEARPLLSGRQIVPPTLAAYPALRRRPSDYLF